VGKNLLLILHFPAVNSSLIMNTSTISITVDKSEVNPLLLEQALYQLLEAFKIEILESEVSNITEEENKEFWG
tara:strand:+ start:331 stop:549 length:219 start_codon:yes stop_codon:yes gene_type:complete